MTIYVYHPGTGFSIHKEGCGLTLDPAWGPYVPVSPKEALSLGLHPCACDALNELEEVSHVDPQP